MNHARLTLSLALLFCVSATPAAAQLLDTSSTGSTFDLRLLNQGASATVTEVSSDGTTTIDADTRLIENTPSAEYEAEAMLGFELSRRSLDEHTEYVVPEASLVRSYAGLESYAATSIRDDRNLEAVASSEERMEIGYKKPARFLGFIPARMHVNVTIDSEGTVSVAYPWYAFLMASGESRTELEARLTADIRDLNDLQAITATNRVSGESTTIVSDEDRPNRAESLRWALILEQLRASLSADARAGA